MSRPNQDRFDEMMDRIADAPGNDPEISALRDLLETMWSYLNTEQETKFLRNTTVVRVNKQSREWAKGAE